MSNNDSLTFMVFEKVQKSQKYYKFYSKNCLLEMGAYVPHVGLKITL